MTTSGVLRIATAGSVDDGKSTLIGRLLHDAKAILEDQLAAIERATTRRGGEGLDLSLLTDGLIAERDQGITIDVAYRYFSTPQRKFIIADTPGHEQYTRNMATGASTADASILLVDARKGLVVQSRRHAIIAGLLGLRHVIVAVNKMDLVGHDEAVFRSIEGEFNAFLERIGITRIHVIPVSALNGDNVVDRSRAMPWYRGPALLELLETLDAEDTSTRPFRFPVQGVSRSRARDQSDRRACMGRIEAGTIARGDAVTVLPGGQRTTVRDIIAWHDNASASFATASAGQSVNLVFTDEIDISRGDLIAAADTEPGDAPRVLRAFDAVVCWMSQNALDTSRRYLVKHTSRTVRARFLEVRAQIDVNTGSTRPAARLALNDIGEVRIATQSPLVVDAYTTLRPTGAFIVIDEDSNETAAAGMIR